MESVSLQGSCCDHGIWERRVGPGVLILSGRNSFQFMNRRAWQLIQEINRAQSVERGALFPTAIVDIYGDLQKLASDHGDDQWERLEVCRVAGRSIRRVLLRAVVFPGQPNQRALLAIILMERVRYREMNLNGLDRLGFTDREHDVVRSLVKGLTNKEVARELGITEQTVKAHIRQIMMKVGTTTRTGILSKLLAAGPDTTITAHRSVRGGMPERTAMHAGVRRVERAGSTPP